MLLSKKGIVQLNTTDTLCVSRMCLAAHKLWNVCNYERQNYELLGLPEFPDWYCQKKTLKNTYWYRQLPSQTAQEVCKVLDGAWKSFFTLKKNGSVQNPQPPRYKHQDISITYMQNGIVHNKEEGILRLSLSKGLKGYMEDTHHVHTTYLFLKDKLFQEVDSIKQLHLYPPEKDGQCSFVMVYEVPDVEALPENGHYLSIDVGVHNLMTCYDSDGTSFIIGRKYFSIQRKYDRVIGKLQQQKMRTEEAEGVHTHPMSRHVRELYQKKNRCKKDYLHKVTSYLGSYCKENDIHTVVIGDLTGVREGKDYGNVTNQSFHSLPFVQIYGLLRYKLSLCGITFVLQEEAYTSQCSPLSKSVSKRYARKKNRVRRGLYHDGKHVWNADAVGAYNILRKYLSRQKIKKTLPWKCLSSPSVIKVAV